MRRVGIIGGTGIGPRLQALGGSPVVVPTEYGPFRARLIQREYCELVLVQRHSAGHKTPPHRINFRAIAKGLQTLGVVGCYATAAVGGLKAHQRPGDMVLLDDFIDLTFRRLTMWDRLVHHADFSTPFSAKMRAAMLESAQALDLTLVDSGTYVGGDGPRYESPAEVATYAQLGGDVVGMTASTEAILLGELKIPYCCLAVITNLGTGISETPLNHQEVVDAMEVAGPAAVKLLLEAADRIAR